jgi:hypothetical protein
MRYSTWCANLLGIALLLVVSAGSAQAQATRTWVSGVGDDVNPCSRTAPCKTFAGAISKTAAGGEISVLDPGGFGTVTITKSISLVNYDSGEAGILASGTNGIIVNGAGVIVYLRGLVIDGAGGVANNPGLNGIRFLNGAALHLDNCVIKNFTSATGIGLNFAPSAAADLFVTDTTITNNGNGSGGGGIFIQPTGAGSAKASLVRVNAENNVLGVRADGTGSTGGISVSIDDSVASGNTFAGITSFTPVGGAATKVMINRSTSANNGTGLNANGAGATLRVGNSVVTGNATGFNIANSATMTSFGNNQVIDNPTGAGPVIPFLGPN